MTRATRFLKAHWLAGAAIVVAASGAVVGVHPWTSDSGPRHLTGNGSQVLGEKITSPPAAPPNSGGGSNGGGNKVFGITGTIVGQFEAGGTNNVQLVIDNENNQAISVTALSATLNRIDKAAGAPAGTCDASTAHVVVHAWTGSAFTVAKNTPAANAPGVIPIEITNASSNACQGATFWFDYHGTASQA